MKPIDLLQRYVPKGRATSNLIMGCLFAVIYLIAAEVGHWLSLTENVATSWPPSGIFLMALVAASRVRWPYLIASGVLANIVSDTFFNNKPFTFSIAMTTANTVEALLGAMYLRWNSAPHFSLERLPDIKRLLIVATIAPLFSAAIAAPAVAWHFDGQVVKTFCVWWSADCVGILTVAPLTWAFLNWNIERSSNWWRTAELMCSFAVIGISSAVIFSEFFPVVEFPFLLMPLLYWPALRFGTVAVASHIGVMAIINHLCDSAQPRPFRRCAISGGCASSFLGHLLGTLLGFGRHVARTRTSS